MTINKYQSLKDHVYNYIAEKIQNGSLLPNQKLNEASICQKLGVSRTPVREALIQLASENLLENIPRRGFIVKELDTKMKLDVFQIVGALDALAANLSVPLVSIEDIAEMTRLADKIDISIQEQNYTDYQLYQNDFHNVYLLKCNNSTLIDLLKSLQTSFIRQIYLSEDKQKLFGVLAQMNEEHRQIIQYFKAKDAQGLEAFIKNVHWKINYTDMI
ncbi:GntR family transcriptional regulator [Paenibacillus alginolyticus]|uniref:GntR family transcriptional regulator n=1 Tax=Paenibacillus alginolyticus TaxID=59839 RepID=UPI00042A9123|nr:GntR family transcriptional regulator [Paenibacillus alginolyticus]MCY9663485.1 GntR family transcriptional regulator [Paenibacillus alginolyticus]